MAKGAFWVIAGPNGVGKTTYAFGNLRKTAGTVRFVNLDEIARGLSPLEPALAERDAARIAIDRAHAFIEGGVTFAMETTLSGRTHFNLAEEARKAGLDVNLHYFSVADPQICMERIARRVAMGGHDVPADVVARRLERSADNVRSFAGLCTLWRIFDSSTLPPKLAAEGREWKTVFVDPDIRDRLHWKLRSWI